jgi:hypothetical protein
MFLLPFRLTFDPAVEIANISVSLLSGSTFVNLFAHLVPRKIPPNSCSLISTVV